MINTKQYARNLTKTHIKQLIIYKKSTKYVKKNKINKFYTILTY